MRLKQNLNIGISSEVSDDKVFLAKRGKPLPTCCSFYFDKPTASVLFITYGRKQLLRKIVPSAKRVVVYKFKMTKYTLSFNLLVDGKMRGRHHVSLHEPTSKWLLAAT